MTFSDNLAKAKISWVNLFEIELGHRIDTDSWAQVTETYTNCWWISHPEGKPSRVEENGSTLTNRATLALCNSNPSSWYWDSSTQRLYIHVADSGDPGDGGQIILSFFYERLCDKQKAGSEIIFTIDSITYFYLPYLDNDDIPSVRLETTGYHEGGTRQSFGPIRLINADGYFDTRLSDYIYESKTFLWKKGEEGDSYSNYETIFRGRTGNIVWTDDYVEINVEDPRKYLDVMIPTSKYNTTDYPNLEDGAEGLPIPERYGVKTNVVPICINTSTGVYKFSKRKLKAIDEIRADGITLTTSTDYTEDLANGQFTLLTTPQLSASTTYYIVIEGDFTISASNYVLLNGDGDAGYSGGQAYHINGSDTWSGQSADLLFKVYGKDSIDGAEELKVSYWHYTDYWPGELRETTDTTKLAQSFTTPASGAFYITRIMMGGWKKGTVSGDIWVSIHSDQVGTQVGIKSNTYDISKLTDDSRPIPFTFPQRETPSMIEGDIQGWYTDSTLMENGANILEDVALNLVGMSASELDSAAFTAFESARTQDLNPQIDTEITFGQFIEIMESSLLFKFMLQLDGTYAPIYYAAGEPAGTPHLRDEDFKYFQCTRNLDSVYRTYRVLYDQSAGADGLYKEEESTSEIAEYCYNKKTTLEVYTYLKDSADAQQLADDLMDLLEYPQRGIVHENQSYLLDAIPTDKVKITRSRADSSTGALSAILYRILILDKQAEGFVTNVAILDSQTY